MTIVISDNAVIFLVFIIGMVVGAFFCWVLINSKAEFDADRRSEHDFELLKLKLDYAVAKHEMEKNANKPPKPLHNPHK